jgi:glucose/arabinose dehydrogenase
MQTDSRSYRRANGGFAAVLSVCAALMLPWMSPPARAQEPVRTVTIGNFANPVQVAVAPGFPRLLFVVERSGRIQVLRDENRLSTPFLDITDIVRGPPDPGAGGEQGLLSVAFAPDYAQSRRFYVLFTNNNGDVEVDEFRRSTGSAVQANRASRRMLLAIPHPGAQNHNGGQLQFGPGGSLYISTGDGGAVEPKGENARRLGSLLGKILRITPLPAGGRPYGIPATNPFVGRVGRDEIFAYGLRNPWRISIDGYRLAIGDVGESRREEINILWIGGALGANFGWPQFEGELVFDNDRPGPDPATFPILTYSHAGGRCTVIGGYFVHDPSLPSFEDRYLYGDFCTGEIRSFVAGIADQQAIDDRPTGLTLPGLTSFGLGFNGQIYFTQLSGRVSRLEPAL